MIEAAPIGQSDAAALEATQFARVYLFDTETVSPQTLEIARKNEAAFLRNCREETASKVARILGMSDSSASRWINTGPLSLAAMFLAVVGLKVVPVNAVVYLKPEEFN